MESWDSHACSCYALNLRSYSTAPMSMSGHRVTAMQMVIRITITNLVFSEHHEIIVFLSFHSCNLVNIQIAASQSERHSMKMPINSMSIHCCSCSRYFLPLLHRSTGSGSSAEFQSMRRRRWWCKCCSFEWHSTKWTKFLMPGSSDPLSTFATCQDVQIQFIVVVVKAKVQAGWREIMNYEMKILKLKPPEELCREESSCILPQYSLIRPNFAVLVLSQMCKCNDLERNGVWSSFHTICAQSSNCSSLSSLIIEFNYQSHSVVIMRKWPFCWLSACRCWRRWWR